MVNQSSLKGTLFRKAADLTTRATTGVALGLSANILTEDKLPYLSKLPSFQSYGAMALMSMIALADKVDGTLARASARFGRPITKKDKDRDPLHDKLRYHALTASSAFMLAQSHTTLGIALAAVEIPLVVRDVRITNQRRYAADDVETAATTFTKFKTGLLNGALIETMSPATAHPVGQIGALVLHGIGAGAAMLSGSIADKKSESLR